MKSVIYLSEATREFSQSAVVDLAHAAAEKNRALDVTGYLSYSRGRFVQYFEGEDDTVTELLNTIKCDPRHTFIQGVESHDLKERLFPSWSMRYISIDESKRFHLEHCIEDNLLYIKHHYYYNQHRRNLLWRHVLSLSKVRKHLTGSLR